MRHLITYENYQINEEFLSRLFNWIRTKYNQFLSGLKGKYKQGAEFAKEWLMKHKAETTKLLSDLKTYSKEEILKLWNWVKKFVSKPEELQGVVKESIETQGLSTLQKIAHYAGVSVKLLLSFAGIITAIMGLCAGSGAIFITGMIIAVLGWGLLSLLNSAT